MQLILLHLILKHKRVLLAGDTQQHTIVILLDAEKLHITAAGDKTVVVTVDITVKFIVACIKVVVCLEQAHLVHSSYAGEHLNGILSMAFDTFERDVALNNLEHPFTHRVNLIIGKRTVHTAIVTFGDSILETHRLTREDFVHSLHEDERQRAHIHAHSVRRGDVKELDILVAVDTHCQPLGDIVHFGSHYTIGHIQPQTVIYLL